MKYIKRAKGHSSKALKKPKAQLKPLHQHRQHRQWTGKYAKCNRKGFYRLVIQNRKVKENVLPEKQGRQTDNMDEGKVEEPKNVFASFFTNSVSSHTFWVDRGYDRDCGINIPLHVREDQVHLRNQNIHRSMGLGEMHPRALRESVMWLSSHSPSYLRSHGSQVKWPVTG